jgi:hypothetical protein
VQTIPVNYFSSPKSYVHANNENGSPPDAKSGKKKKKSFFFRGFLSSLEEEKHIQLIRNNHFLKNFNVFIEHFEDYSKNILYLYMLVILQYCE